MEHVRGHRRRCACFEQKARLFEEAQKHRWLLVLSHEPDQPAGYLEDDGRWRPSRAST